MMMASFCNEKKRHTERQKGANKIATISAISKLNGFVSCYLCVYTIFRTSLCIYAKYFEFGCKISLASVQLVWTEAHISEYCTYIEHNV